LKLPWTSILWRMMRSALFSLTWDAPAWSLKASTTEFFGLILPSSLDLRNIRLKTHAFVKNLRTIFPEIGSPDVTFASSKTWIGTLWRKYYRPLRISDNLTVWPAWEPVPTSHEGFVIKIDPGPAFGTGEHATTRMCLKAIEACAPPKGWSMLDVGTGSGILAIYGAMLGAADRDGLGQ
jgi:ribosomal protein L11 methyltransferase